MIKESKLSTEDWEIVYSLTEEYWKDFSELVNKYLKACPNDDFKTALMLRIQDASSVYSVKELK
jgi:hypothetical protein